MTAQKIVRVGNIEIANDKPFVLFGGMNVLESRDLAMQVCEQYVKVTEKLGIPYTLKEVPVPAKEEVDRACRILRTEEYRGYLEQPGRVSEK